MPRSSALPRPPGVPTAALEEFTDVLAGSAQSGKATLYALLEVVATWTGAGYVSVWARDDDQASGPPRPQYTWPRGAPQPREVDRVRSVAERGFGSTGDDSAVLVVRYDGDADRSVGDARRHRERALLDYAAHAVATVLATSAVGAGLDRARARRGRLVRELDGARAHLDRAHELERRSLVTEILGLSSPRLATIRTAVEQLEIDFRADDRDGAVRLAADVSGVVENLAEQFRTVVTGAHSTVLRERGLRVALNELAAGMPRRVDVSVAAPETAPDTGTVTAPELFVATYHLLATVLRESSQNGVGTVRVTVAERGRVLVATVELTVALPDRMRALVAVTSGHAQALGGRLGVGFDGGRCVVRLALPRDLRPVSAAELERGGQDDPDDGDDAGAAPAIPSPSAVVRDAVAAARDAVSDPDLAGDLAVALRRLDGPVRLAFVAADLAPGIRAVRAVLHRSPPTLDPGRANWLTFAPDGGLGAILRAGPDGEPVFRVSSRTVGLGAAAPGRAHLGVGVVPGRAGASLLAASTGADAVVSLLSSPDDRPTRQEAERADGRALGIGAVLAAAPQSGSPDDDTFAAVDGTGTLTELLEQRLVPWADVLRARSVLHVAIGLLRDAHGGADALAPILRAAGEAHAIRELEALADLWSGGVFGEPQDCEAVRLLGGYGRDAATRLDLPPDTTFAAARGALIGAVARWKSPAGRGGSGSGSGGVAASVAAAVTETCEYLLGTATREPDRRLGD